MSEKYKLYTNVVFSQMYNMNSVSVAYSASKMNEQMNECKGPGCQIPLTYGGASITSVGQVVTFNLKMKWLNVLHSGMKCEEG